jgi:hypothetical protein
MAQQSHSTYVAQDMFCDPNILRHGSGGSSEGATSGVGHSRRRSFCLWRIMPPSAPADLIILNRTSAPVGYPVPNNSDQDTVIRVVDDAKRVINIFQPGRVTRCER